VTSSSVEDLEFLVEYDINGTANVTERFTLVLSEDANREVEIPLFSEKIIFPNAPLILSPSTLKDVEVGDVYLEMAYDNRSLATVFTEVRKSIKITMPSNINRAMFVIQYSVLNAKVVYPLFRSFQATLRPPGYFSAKNVKLCFSIPDSFLPGDYRYYSTCSINLLVKTWFPVEMSSSNGMVSMKHDLEQLRGDDTVWMEIMISEIPSLAWFGYFWFFIGLSLILLMILVEILYFLFTSTSVYLQGATYGYRPFQGMSLFLIGLFYCSLLINSIVFYNVYLFSMPWFLTHFWPLNPMTPILGYWFSTLFVWPIATFCSSFHVFRSKSSERIITTSKFRFWVRNYPKLSASVLFQFFSSFIFITTLFIQLFRAQTDLSFVYDQWFLLASGFLLMLTSFLLFKVLSTLIERDERIYRFLKGYFNRISYSEYNELLKTCSEKLRLPIKEVQFSIKTMIHEGSLYLEGEKVLFKGRVGFETNWDRLYSSEVLKQVTEMAQRLSTFNKEHGTEVPDTISKRRMFK
jgi:hypothetical protein